MTDTCEASDFEMAVISFKEYMELSPDELRRLRAEERPHPEVKFNRQALVLEVHHGPAWYELDLERCNDPGQILDWICQLNGKTWMTNELMGQLVEALDAACDEIFGHGIQPTFCPFGASKRADWRKARGSMLAPKSSR